MSDRLLDWAALTGSLPALLGEGLANTLLIAVTANLLGLVIGIVTAALLRSRRWWLRTPARVYASALRGVPVLLVVMLVGLGLPMAGLHPFGRDAWGYAVLGIGLVSGAYVADILHSGAMTVGPAQLHAARLDGATALQAMWLVTVPQLVRECTPALLAQLVRDVKESSLVYVLGLGFGQRELFFIAQTEAARSGSVTPLIAAGAVYLAITAPLTLLAGRVMLRQGRAPAAAPLTRRPAGAYR